MTVPSSVRRYVIPAAFALLCLACVHADARLGTPWWMTVSMDWLLFPVVTAITVLALHPGVEHLRTAKLRMAALRREVSRIIVGKLMVRSVMALPGR
jgi:hypothetical protein